MNGIVMPDGTKPMSRPALSAAQTSELLKNRTPENETKAFLGNLGLVLMLLPRFSGNDESKEDLFQTGCLGLILAVRGFCPEKGMAFSTYAVPVIHGNILRYLATSRLIHVPREKFINQAKNKDPLVKNAQYVQSLDVPVSPENDAAYTDQIADEKDLIMDFITKADLHAAVEKLEEKDRQLLFCRYQMELSQEKTGQVLGMNQRSVSRREKRLLKALRAKLA